MLDIKINDDIIEDIELFIFDKDGTLIDLYHYWSQMIGLRSKLICDRLGLEKIDHFNLMYGMGVDVDAAKLRPEGPVGIKKREFVLKAAVDYLGTIGFPDETDLCIDVFAETDQLSSEDIQKFIRPIKGVNELLDEIIAQNGKIAIATTDITERAKLAFAFLDIIDKIDLVAGADLVKISKPDPEMIDLILEELQVDKTNTVMIGDAITDVQIGSNAKLKASIGLLSGLSDYEQLKKFTPYIAEDISKIEIIDNR